MRHWLATPADQQRRDWIKRFDARFWTVDFPRPMMAAATTPAPRALRVDLGFVKADDLAGLIWESVDRFDHPLLSYATSRDYRGLTLRFRWQAEGGVLPLDAVDGATLTIEGRDAAGNPRTWYVPLWNYAAGTPVDAVVTLAFDTLAGGFLLPGEADPVFAGDIDRLFISLVPRGYTGDDRPLAAPVDAAVTLSDIACDGPLSTIAIGDVFAPPHRLRIATGYDDGYNLTPERLLRGIQQAGYTTWINHYVGMSHFFQLGWNAASGLFEVDPARPLNLPAAAWHRDFAARAGAAGFTLIVSLSFELLDRHAPAAWKQRDAAGNPALTGYTPPSTLLSPASAAAMAWLQSVAQALVALAVAAGHAPHFQVGEPWWWVDPAHRPCFYDAATVAAYPAETGRPVPPWLTDARGALDGPAQAYLDWLGVVLGRATLALRDAVRVQAPAATTYLLFYAPQVVLDASPELIRANLPAAWAFPAFDVLQLEDYDFVTIGDIAGQARGRAAITGRLGYPLSRQHYFAGFVAGADVALGQWPLVAAAAAASLDGGTAETFVWAWPQVARDGFVAFEIEGDETVPVFHDVLFPLALGYGASGGPQFSTQVALSSSGFEQRNSSWSDARLHYDAGVGIRSEADLVALVGFFRARRGQAHAFRFTDPFDHGSGAGDAIAASDQLLGSGDGINTRFALVKRYGDGDDAQL
ncbi:MAG: non-contractile tail sheath protein, partial [Janthinobacterium lividum]